MKTIINYAIYILGRMFGFYAGLSFFAAILLGSSIAYFHSNIQMVFSGLVAVPIVYLVFLPLNEIRILLKKYREREKKE